jgi:hypothetical protein
VRTFWRVVIVAHVGSTIIADAILELVDVAATARPSSSPGSHRRGGEWMGKSIPYP